MPDLHFIIAVILSVGLLVNFTFYYLFAWVIVMPLYLVGPKGVVEQFANRIFTYNLTVPIWAIHYWTGVRYYYYGEKYMRSEENEKSITIVNHESFLDGPLLTVFQHMCGCMDDVRYILWDHVMKIPFGWASKFVGHIMITCKWNKDQYILRDGLENFESKPYLKSVCFFPEGYVKNKKSMKKCQDYCKENGLPVLKQTLWPRAKGFDFCLSRIREFQQQFPDTPCYVYDCTTVYEGYREGGPSFFEVFTRTSRGMKIHFVTEKFSMKDLPSDENGIKEWIESRYMVKEKLLEYFHKHGAFPEKRRNFKGVSMDTKTGKPQEMELPFVRNVVWSFAWVVLAWFSCSWFLLFSPIYVIFFGAAILYYHHELLMKTIGLSRKTKSHKKHH